MKSMEEKPSGHFELHLNVFTVTRRVKEKCLISASLVHVICGKQHCRPQRLLS